MAQFEDIVIVDLDVQKTTWSRVHSAMRTLYLKLNRDPDIAWTKFFYEERSSRVELKRHGLWIEDGYVVFDCLLIDVDNHHLPDIRQSIAYANQRSHELLETQRIERARNQARARDEAELLKSLRANIRDDRERAPADESATFESEAEPDTAVSLEAAAQSQLEAAPTAEPDAGETLEPAAQSQLEPAPDAQPDTAASLEETAQSRYAPEEPAPAAAEPALDVPEPAPAAAVEPPEDEPEPDVSESDLQLKRNDWRARFRAAFERNKN